jgi:superfamily II DNA or RNA helicase
MEENPAKNKVGTPFERWGIWRNEERNRLIAEGYRQLLDKLGLPEDCQTLVVVFSVEHAIYLKQFLPEFKLCYDKIEKDTYSAYVRSGMLDPETEPMMDKRQRIEMTKDFSSGQLRKVIATDVWSTGVDFVSLPLLVRADGRPANKIIDTQIPGRVTRTSEGKEVAIMVDCADRFDAKMEGRFKGRVRHYKKKGWKMVGLPKRGLSGGSLEQE